MTDTGGLDKGSGWLSELEDLLRRREELWSLSVYYHGASERSTSYGPEDEDAWNEVSSEIGEAEARISTLAQQLRLLEPEHFAGWVADRRRRHEARLASPDIAAWEVGHLRSTIERWERFLREDYRDFYRWMSW